MSSPATNPAESDLPSSGVRSFISLLLFIHLTGLAIAVLANVAPVSGLRAQLGTVPIVRQYYQLLHLFLGYNFHLTDDAPLDSDLRIEVETNWTGAARPDAQVLTLPAPDLGHGLRAQHFRSLLGTTGSLVSDVTGGDTESVEGLLPRAIAGKLLAEAGIDSGKHRVRLQWYRSLSTDEVQSPDLSQRNPLAAGRYSTLYEADVTFAGGELILTKSASALETSPVNRRARSVMVSAISRYWDDLCTTFGDGWNQFWFRPSDPVVLCWLRILSGLMAIYLVISYTADIDRLFGPDGMLPLELIDQLRGSNWTSFSYFDYLHTSGELKSVHYIGLAVLVLYTVGAFTRITSVLALVVVLSYIHRATLLTSQVEPILTMVMFYVCLGPAGSYLSVDRLRKRRLAAHASPANAALILAVPASSAATVAVRLIQVHLCVAYLMMGLAKLSGPNQVWWMGDAVWWLVARPGTRLVDLTGLLAEHPYVVNAWTHAVVAFELAFPILIWNRLARPLLLALAVPMWLSLAIITGLVPFCLMMLIASLAFVPAGRSRLPDGTWYWQGKLNDEVLPGRQDLLVDRRRSILYDGSQQ